MSAFGWGYGTSGTPGPQGPPGPEGRTGPPGPVGPTGSRGTQGVEGPTGPTGPTGAQGLPGSASSTGATGPTGASGNLSGLTVNHFAYADSSTEVTTTALLTQDGSNNTITVRPASDGTAFQVVSATGAACVAVDTSAGSLVVQQSGGTFGLDVQTLSDSVSHFSVDGPNNLVRMGHNDIINGSILRAGDQTITEISPDPIPCVLMKATALLLTDDYPDPTSSAAFLPNTGSGTGLLQINNASVSITADSSAALIVKDIDGNSVVSVNTLGDVDVVSIAGPAASSKLVVYNESTLQILNVDTESNLVTASGMLVQSAADSDNSFNVMRVKDNTGSNVFMNISASPTGCTQLGVVHDQGNPLISAGTFQYSGSNWNDVGLLCTNQGLVIADSFTSPARQFVIAPATGVAYTNMSLDIIGQADQRKLLITNAAGSEVFYVDNQNERMTVRGAANSTKLAVQNPTGTAVWYVDTSTNNMQVHDATVTIDGINSTTKLEVADNSSNVVFNVNSTDGVLSGSAVDRTRLGTLWGTNNFNIRLVPDYYAYEIIVQGITPNPQSGQHVSVQFRDSGSSVINFITIGSVLWGATISPVYSTSSGNEFILLDVASTETLTFPVSGSIMIYPIENSDTSPGGFYVVSNFTGVDNSGKMWIKQTNGVASSSSAFPMLCEFFGSTNNVLIWSIAWNGLIGPTYPSSMGARLAAAGRQKASPRPDDEWEPVESTG